MYNGRKVIVYTDASVPNHHDPELILKCGWAFKLIFEDGHEEINSGFTMCNTSYQMEMIAILEAMKSITDKSTIVEIRSDSENVVKILNEEYKEHVNKELWNEIKRERDKFDDISFKSVISDGKDKNLVEVHMLASKQAET